MAKTTLNVDDQLLHDAKRVAAERGTTLTKLVEDALRAALMPPTAHPAFRLRWRPVRGRAPAQVDIADRDALAEAMDRE